MDQISIVLYLAKKGLSAVAVHDDLVATLSIEVISYSLVIDHIREARFGTSNPATPFSEIDCEPDHCDEAILLALNEQPFASIRQLA
jgi:hypothetical protein